MKVEVEVFCKRLGARMAFLLSAPLAALSWAMIAASHHIWVILASRSEKAPKSRLIFLIIGSSLGSSLVCSRPTERFTMLRLPILTSGQISWYDETFFETSNEDNHRGSLGTIISNMFALGSLFTYSVGYLIPRLADNP